MQLIQQLVMGRSSAGSSAQNTEPDLLKAVLNGKLGEINWMSTLLGGDNHETAEDGNALAQLFKGGLFGSAVNDSPMSIQNDEGKISRSRF